MNKTEENRNWATPTLREVPFWRDDMTPEEYDIEREYYARNFHLVKQRKYVPLWKQREQQKVNEN